MRESRPSPAQFGQLSAVLPEPLADRWDKDPQVAAAALKLRECAANGIEVIVEPKVVGLGRCVPRIVRVNEQVDIDVIVATGVYTCNEVPFQFLCTRGAALR